MNRGVVVVVRLSVVLSVLTVCGASASDAATLAVFNTGVDSGGTVLAGGSVDPHYRLVASADPRFPGPSAFVVQDNAFPSPEWLPNSSTSKWIAPRPQQRGADPSFGNLPGQYTYRTSFDLSGVDPQTVRVTGQWATDDAGRDILINGVSTGISSTRDLFSFSGFVIDSGFVPGVNTVDFVTIDNGINPTGLRVELSVSTTANFSPTATPTATIAPTRIPTSKPTPTRTPTRTATPQVSLNVAKHGWCSRPADNLHRNVANGRRWHRRRAERHQLRQRQHPHCEQCRREARLHGEPWHRQRRHVVCVRTNWL